MSWPPHVLAWWVRAVVQTVQSWEQRAWGTPGDCGSQAGSRNMRPHHAGPLTPGNQTAPTGQCLSLVAFLRLAPVLSKAAQEADVPHGGEARWAEPGGAQETEGGASLSATASLLG